MFGMVLKTPLLYLFREFQIFLLKFFVAIDYCKYSRFLETNTLFNWSVELNRATR